MVRRGTRGAYRKEDRVALPKELQRELVDKAAARIGNCQELARRLNIPKSSVHYYQVGRITMPISILLEMIEIAEDEDLERRIKDVGVQKDRTWANEYAVSIYREMCREMLRLPTMQELQECTELRRKAATIISYVLAEGSVWLQKKKWGECVTNVTFADHETDLYEHFRSLCKEIFQYDMGPPQEPGNNAKAIRGFIYSRFIAEWLLENGVLPGEKSSRDIHLPPWVLHSDDALTWMAALQPWCDGEGSVRRPAGISSASFSLAQSRHTDLDLVTLPRRRALRRMGRTLPAGMLNRAFVYGMTASEYCEAFCRSVVFDDVHLLFRKLGFQPRLKIRDLFLKDDGFWSCQWELRFSAKETLGLANLGLVIQERKRWGILARAEY